MKSQWMILVGRQPSSVCQRLLIWNWFISDFLKFLIYELMCVKESERCNVLLPLNKILTKGFLFNFFISLRGIQYICKYAIVLYTLNCLSLLKFEINFIHSKNHSFKKIQLFIVNGNLILLDLLKKVIPIIMKYFPTRPKKERNRKGKMTCS